MCLIMQSMVTYVIVGLLSRIIIIIIGGMLTIWEVLEGIKAYLFLRVTETS